MTDSVQYVGNNGGDYITLTNVENDKKEDIVHLKIGHCCVNTIDVVLPIAVLSSLLSTLLVDGENIKTLFEANVEWPEKYKTELMEKIKL